MMMPGPAIWLYTGSTSLTDIYATHRDPFVTKKFFRSGIDTVIKHGGSYGSKAAKNPG
jgi:hypothetical protein